MLEIADSAVDAADLKLPLRRSTGPPPATDASNAVRLNGGFCSILFLAERIRMNINHIISDCYYSWY